MRNKKGEYMNHVAWEQVITIIAICLIGYCLYQAHQTFKDI
jgi:hypothetical protein